ncbi:MAG: co-chaperone YbbN [Burkholderiales bacterium]|nr:co-chaperone YbbN [Burkholderiales bacterium]
MAAHSIDVGSDNFRDVVLEGSQRAPVVVDFWAPWCAPCRALTPILEKLADEYAGRFTLAKINSDENQDLAASFGVRGIPAVKAVVGGKLVDEFVGALPESQVRSFIERILPSPSEITRAEAAALLAAGQTDKAIEALDAALALDPRNEAAKIDRIDVLARLGRIEGAQAALEDLSPLSLDEPRVAALKAQLAFAQGTAQDPAALARRIDANPNDLDARLELARHYVQGQAYEPALEQLMAIVRADRKFRDDIGRKTLIEVFNLLGGQGDLVSRYRRLLSAALY